MTEPVLYPTAVRVEGICSGPLAAPLDVHAWTGRSALSSATTTPRPHIATAGPRKTRVSAMRLSGSRIDRQLVVGVPLSPVITTMVEPSNPGPFHAVSG